MRVDPSAFTAPFRMQPGLSRLQPGQRQLTPIRPGDPILAAKLAVLSRHADQALCVMPGWDDGPALAALAGQAAVEHPDAFVVDDAGHGPRRWTATRLGWSTDGASVDGDGPPQIGDCLRSLPPRWRAAGLLCLAFAEDFAAIEVSADTGSRIPWLAVCLPSHWAPHDKLGRSFAEVHRPVADNRTLLRAADALAQLVTGPTRWQRAVWTVSSRGDLDGHPQRIPAASWPCDADAAAIGKSAWLRVEQQTFIPVPGHAQAVFTILVEVQRLADVLADPQHGDEVRRNLRAAIASMSAAVLDYRRLTAARDRLLDWLADGDAAE